MHLANDRFNQGELLAPPVKVIRELEPDIGLRVPVEAEELRRNQSAVTHALARPRCVGISTNARCRAGGAHRLHSAVKTCLRRSQGWGVLHGLVDQRIKLRIVVTLPPLGIGPLAVGGRISARHGNLGTELGRHRFVRQASACCEQRARCRDNQQLSVNHGAPPRSCAPKATSRFFADLWSSSAFHPSKGSTGKKTAWDGTAAASASPAPRLPW